MRIALIVLMGAMQVACSSIALVQRSNDGLDLLSTVGSQIGPSWAKLGDGERLGGVSAHAYGGGDFVIGVVGMGLRGGIGGDSGSGDGQDLRFGGFPVSAHLVFATPPPGYNRPRLLWAYAGGGYIFNGNLKLPMDSINGVFVNGYHFYAGARVLVIPFSAHVTYNLFVELGSTSSFATDHGSFNSRAVRFGSLFTF